MDASEKRGRNLRPSWLINGFRQAVLDSGLVYVPVEGYPFTWFKSLGMPHAVEERLDRALANTGWFNIFPTTTLENLAAPSSDHYPILLNSCPVQRPYLHKRSFRYENAWYPEPGFKKFVTDAWHMHSLDSIVSKLSSCAADMVVWSIDHCNKLKSDIEECRQQRQTIRLNSFGPSQEQVVSLRKKTCRLLSQEDAYWRQRAKSHWYRDGDRNTKFFHSSSPARKKVNRIVSLKDDSSNKISDSRRMCNVAKKYFLNLFQKQNTVVAPVIQAIRQSVFEDDNVMLTAPFTREQFREADRKSVV